jgi:tRNA-2-methylthio-N6-dimethylallyladenosine synthase
MIGSSQRVLLNALSKKKVGTLKGKTDNNRIVEVEAEDKLLNQFVEVKITAFDGKNLRGEIISDEI